MGFWGRRGRTLPFKSIFRIKYKIKWNCLLFPEFHLILYCDLDWELTQKRAIEVNRMKRNEMRSNAINVVYLRLDFSEALRYCRGSFPSDARGLEYISPLPIINNIFHNTWLSSKVISKFILSFWTGLQWEVRFLQFYKQLWNCLALIRKLDVFLFLYY